MRLAFSSNAFKKNTLDEAVTAIARAGYRGVELMADRPHAYPPEFGRQERGRLKSKSAELGLAVSNINAFTLFALGDTYHPTWIENDPGLRQARIAHTIACVEMAAEFECATISLQPGGPLIGTGLDRAEAGRRFAAGLEQVLPAARRLGVALAIEPEPGLFIQTSKEFSQFKAEFFAGEKTIAMNCDVGHLFCVAEDPAEVINRLPAEIAHVHLEDIGANRVHQHLAPGKGVIDFAAIFAALERIKYASWVTVELYPYETTAAEVARTAMEHLKQWTV
ncbi:MAG TPA: sugar phosphate isomerase/epimerase [Tepidisphaeraceae bacterium]|nr:sugar phosphate isomerase/epimerase [Tepidisphaeraceae bacterium]